MGVQKPRKDSPINHYPLLEEQLVHLFIKSMDEAEEAFKQSTEPEKYFPDSNMSLLWWNLSSELIFFLLFQFLTFPTFVENIHQNLMERSHISLKEGRDFLMWALLQFISGSIGNYLKKYFKIYFFKKCNSRILYSEILWDVWCPNVLPKYTSSFIYRQKHSNRLLSSFEIIFTIRRERTSASAKRTKFCTKTFSGGHLHPFTKKNGHPKWRFRQRGQDQLFAICFTHSLAKTLRIFTSFSR